MATEEKVTYCRICEPLCGMVATVKDGELTKLRPDPDHPLSAGFACPKGIAMTEVQNDPDRVLHPLRRRADGSFERVTWERGAGRDRRAARRDSRSPRRRRDRLVHGQPGRLLATRTRCGSRASSTRSARPHYYTASSQDVSNRFAASALLYGSPFIVPIPDLARTDFLLVVGANPLVSHGSVLSAPRIKDQLHAITDRGGRVVVVDPRRSETARAFEHLRDRPRRRRLAAALDPPGDLRRGARGSAARSNARRAGPRSCAGSPASSRPRRPRRAAASPRARVRALARDLAAADRAAVYGRTGSCLGRNGTLVAFLLDALNVVTGNLDREGGAMFGDPPIDFSRVADLAGLATYGQVRSRVGDLPEVLGSLPAVADGQGDDDAGQGPDPGDVRLRRQPGALACPTATSSSAAIERARAVGRDRPLRHRHLAPLRLRAPGDDDVRARGPPAALPRPVHARRSSR